MEIAGVSVHIGSQITDVKPFAATMERVAELARALQADGHVIKYLDAGGGLGIPYENPDGPRLCGTGYFLRGGIDSAASRP